MKLEEIINSIANRTTTRFYSFVGNQTIWRDWYCGKVADFHNYTVFNGVKDISCTRYSLQMAKKVCEDWANLLINEKTDIVLTDERSQANLEDIFARTNFWQIANEGVEKTFALGNGAWVIDVKGVAVGADGKPAQSGTVNVYFCNALKMRPITVENGVLTECAFVSETAMTNKQKRFDVQVHLKGKDGNYWIYNFAGTGTDERNITLSDKEPYTVINTGSDIAWFVPLKPNMANNCDFDSAFGVSVFANAVDTLKSIDLIYDSYANEFLLGKKRLFIKQSLLQINELTGETRKPFDDKDISVYNLPNADGDINKIIADNTQTLRVADHQTALQNMLDLLGFQTGFGTDHFKFTRKGIMSTATQIISENSEMFRNVRKQEILVEHALTALVKALAYASTKFGGEPINAGNVTIRFDDSIIEDKATERASDRTDVAMGVMSKAEYRAKWYAETEEVAQAKIDEIDESTLPDLGLINEYTQMDGQPTAGVGEED